MSKVSTVLPLASSVGIQPQTRRVLIYLLLTMHMHVHDGHPVYPVILHSVDCSDHQKIMQPVCKMNSVGRAADSQQTTYRKVSKTN